MWSQHELLAIKREIYTLKFRYEVEEFLARNYGLITQEINGCWEYTRPGFDGWLIVRYERDCVISAAFGGLP